MRTLPQRLDAGLPATGIAAAGFLSYQLCLCLVEMPIAHGADPLPG